MPTDVYVFGGRTARSIFGHLEKKHSGSVTYINVTSRQPLHHLNPVHGFNISEQQAHHSFAILLYQLHDWYSNDPYSFLDYCILTVKFLLTFFNHSHILVALSFPSGRIDHWADQKASFGVFKYFLEKESVAILDLNEHYQTLYYTQLYRDYYLQTGVQKSVSSLLHFNIGNIVRPVLKARKRTEKRKLQRLRQKAANISIQ